jgi:hypothetical protein
MVLVTTRLAVSVQPPQHWRLRPRDCAKRREEAKMRVPACRDLGNPFKILFPEILHIIERANPGRHLDSENLKFASHGCH